VQKRFYHHLAKHDCVEKCDCCGDHHSFWEIVCLLMMRLLWILVATVAPEFSWLFSEITALAGVEQWHFSDRRDEYG